MKLFGSAQGISSGILDLDRLDRLAYQDSPVHRLDPRAKIVVTLVYLVCVVSFGKYEITGLLPFFVFPFVLASMAGLPLGYIAKRVLAVSPFAFFIGVFNPLLDREVILHLGTVGVSGGWVSFASILIRFTLTISVALILIATTSFNGVCMAFEKLGMPSVLANQLLILYRYIFVLVDEASRLGRARALRTFGKKGMEMKVYGHILGNLLLRSIARAQRVHLAMRCRGFSGEIRLMRRLKIGASEVAFVLLWASVFLGFRFFNVPQIIGGLVTK